MMTVHDTSPLVAISYICVECGCEVREGEPHFEELVCESCYEEATKSKL